MASRQLPPSVRDVTQFGGLVDALQRWTGVVSKIADPLDRIEGLRFLLRMLSSSGETFIETWNPDRPSFRSSVYDIRKVYADSPDTDYLRSTLLLKNGRRYRIFGVVPPTTLYFGVQLYRTKGTLGNHIADTEIKRERDGTFELIVTAEDPDTLPAGLQTKTVLQGNGDEVAVIVRQYYLDRTSEPPISLHIELLSEPGFVPNTELSTELFSSGARLAIANFEATISNTIRAHETLSELCAGRFVRADGTRLFPTLDNRYLLAFFTGLRPAPSTPRGDTKVVLVRGRKPKCRYFSLCLYNRWLESLDYNTHTVYLNHQKLYFVKDRFEVALSSVDPGHRNWLNVTNHDSVHLLSRELLPEDPEDPEFEIEITTISKLHERRDSNLIVHARL